jgi:hypothetical protein
MRWQLPGGETRCEKGFRDRTATEQESARREREAARKVAAELRRAMPTDAAPETKVFGRIPRMRDLMPDLERAEIDYKDADGRQADFPLASHDLRHDAGQERRGTADGDRIDASHGPAADDERVHRPQHPEHGRGRRGPARRDPAAGSRCAPPYGFGRSASGHIDEAESIAKKYEIA